MVFGDDRYKELARVMCRVMNIRFISHNSIFSVSKMIASVMSLIIASQTVSNSARRFRKIGGFIGGTTEILLGGIGGSLIGYYMFYQDPGCIPNYVTVGSVLGAMIQIGAGAEGALLGEILASEVGYHMHWLERIIEWIRSRILNLNL